MAQLVCFVCVCVRACVRVCVRTRACVRVGGPWPVNMGNSPKRKEEENVFKSCMSLFHSDFPIKTLWAYLFSPLLVHSLPISLSLVWPP